jgi:hypothetical protein
VSFSLHTTYRSGHPYLPRPSDLPPCRHTESQEGYFRFGRAIASTEHVTHSEARVNKALSEWLAECSRQCPCVSVNQDR